MTTLKELDVEELNAVCGGEILSTIAHAIVDGINAGFGALGLGAPLSMGGGGGSGSNAPSYMGPVPRLPAL
jgi:hypothetical protein